MIFSTIKGSMASKPEYTNNFAIITDRNGVTKAKWGYIARCVYMTPNYNPNIVVLPNDLKQAYA